MNSHHANLHAATTLLLASLLSGCDVAIDDVSDEVRAAICSHAVECHVAKTEADCVATTSVEINYVDFEKMTEYTQNGTVIYHPEKLDACLAALEGNSVCSRTARHTNGGYEKVNNACGAVFEGAVVEGDTCVDDEQCVSKTCRRVDPECIGACCAEKCIAAMPVPVAKIGESCQKLTDGICEAGAYCEFASGQCVPQADEGAGCEDSSYCREPLVCSITKLDFFGTCVKPAAHGATCKSDTWGNMCDRDDDMCDVTTNICVTEGLLGASCNHYCVEYAYCDSTTFTCVERVGEGQPCDLAVSENQCRDGLNCINGKCRGETEPVCQ